MIMAKNKTIIIGHINPDTDSIIAAMVAAFYSEKLFGVKALAKRAGDFNNETKFILSLLPKSAKICLPGKINKVKTEKVILVDTTEPSQIIAGVNENNLLAIIDHHNLGGIKSSMPIYIRIEPLGCACSVLYKILREKKIKLSENAAFLLIAAIVSDTLFFNSPTTTDEDKKIAKELNKIARLNIKKLANDMFKAKSNLDGVKTKDIIEGDYKFYQMGKSKVGIGVWETVDSSSANKKKIAIMNALRKKKNKDKLDYLFFGVVDILKKNTYLYLPAFEEEKLAKTVFNGKVNDGIMPLEKVVSRKKQIAPALNRKLS
ncbi:MAG: manganese-dependent inorganic pyrophosphatase [Patescibacteria group bacterium]|nr:manganese-dependent inorganic pyrophosphatase [Patescibacteria group bacterium]